MSKIVNYFKEQIVEIASEKSLSLYGFFLTVIHCWNYIRWSPQHVSMQPVALCWSFFQECEPYRAWLGENHHVIYTSYFILALTVCILFLLRKKIELAFFGLFILTVMRLGFMLHDYRFMGNYHYMANIASLVFLFVPHKIFFTKVTLVAFYVGAGFLRFNDDWLSGALISSKLLKDVWLEWAMAYVIILELCFSLLLLSKNSRYFYFALIQFLAFHAYSVAEVGYMFPLIMFSLLAIFILDIVFRSEYTTRFSKKWGYTAIALFMLAQLYPLIRYPQSALTGEGRLIALNMFDAKTECYNRVQFHTEEGIVEKTIPKPHVGFRIGCDPLVYYNYLKSYCRSRNPAEFKDLDFHLFVKRTTDSAWTKALELNQVCQNPPKISFLGEFKQAKAVAHE